MATASYSKAERFLARFLASSPALKRTIKTGYEYASWVRHRRPYSFSSAFDFSLVGDDHLEAETFFGYYDKSPINRSNTHLLFQQALAKTTERPDPERHINVLLLEMGTDNISARLPSRTYNWQQGTKLQWLSDTRFAFNDYDPQSDTYVAKVFDTSLGSVVKTLRAPIYDCFGEEFALTLNFDRLARLSADYGYFNRAARAFDVSNLMHDGVFRIDMQRGDIQLILPLADLARLCQNRSMKNAEHTVNHIMIAPDGARFVVIHRWYRSGRRFDRLVLADTTGDSTSKVLADDGMVSHCFWVDARTILGYFRIAERGVGYWLIDVDTGETHSLPTDALGSYGDGHPHVRGDWFVTDTYPDKARMQHLLYCNWRTGEVRKLGEFFHGFAFRHETRCDLHPRLSPDGKRVFFDSVFSGKRRLYCMNVPE